MPEWVPLPANTILHQVPPSSVLEISYINAAHVRGIQVCMADPAMAGSFVTIEQPPEAPTFPSMLSATDQSQPAFYHMEQLYEQAPIVHQPPLVGAPAWRPQAATSHNLIHTPSQSEQISIADLQPCQSPADGPSDVQFASRKRSRDRSSDTIPDVECEDQHAYSSAPRLMRKRAANVLCSASNMSHAAKPNWQPAAAAPSSYCQAPGKLQGTAQTFSTRGSAATASDTYTPNPTSPECLQSVPLCDDDQNMLGAHLLHSPFVSAPLVTNHSLTGSINLNENSSCGPQVRQTCTIKRAWTSDFMAVPHTSTASSQSVGGEAPGGDESRALHEQWTDDMEFPIQDRCRSVSMDFQDNLADMMTFEDCLSGVSTSPTQTGRDW